jgi:hypothetical protein
MNRVHCSGTPVLPDDAIAHSSTVPTLRRRHRAPYVRLFPQPAIVRFLNLVRPGIHLRKRGIPAPQPSHFAMQFYLSIN